MLPSPRPKKARPERSALVLVLREDQRVLLELRPPAGIWGGLLALPELTLGSSEAAARWAFDSMGLQVLPSQNLPPLPHAFTHSTLDLHPLLLDVISSPAAAREPGWAWLALDQLSEAPLPTPVRRILQALPAPAGVSPAAAIDAASGIAR